MTAPWEYGPSRENGGMVMVQTFESAEYDGMPRSAVATGLVDYELPPSEMAATLIAYSTNTFNKNKSGDSIPAPKYENILKKNIHSYARSKPVMIFHHTNRTLSKDV